MKHTFVLAFAFLVATVSAAAAERPNIVLLFADDLGYGELGCFGGTDIPTPHIDSIAQNGVRYTSGYVTAPFCAASRAGLLTGRYQTRFGFELNPTGPRNADPRIGLPPDQPTIADHLRDAGYVTGLLGKWHLGATAQFHPQRRGFDEFFGFLHEGHYFVPPPWKGMTTWLRRKTLPDGGQGRWVSMDGRTIWSTHMGYHEPDYDADNPILRNSQPVDERAHLTDALTREAESFIDRHQAQPFFLYVAYNAVHSPMQGADTYMTRFAHIDDIHRRIFAAMLAHLDDSVGRILGKLRDCGLERDTLVVFLSDNGGPTRELTSSNLPLRGEKGQLYEGGIRIPFLMQQPGRVPAGRVDDRPVIALDLHATFLDAARFDGSRNGYDGKSLLRHLDADAAPRPHDQLFWRVGHRAAFRSGDWKIVRHGRRNNPDADWQLFDLAHDLAETHDLAAEQPQRLADLVQHWETWNAEMVDPLW